MSTFSSDRITPFCLFVLRPYPHFPLKIAEPFKKCFFLSWIEYHQRNEDGGEEVAKKQKLLGISPPAPVPPNPLQYSMPFTAATNNKGHGRRQIISPRRWRTLTVYRTTSNIYIIFLFILSFVVVVVLYFFRNRKWKKTRPTTAATTLRWIVGVICMWRVGEGLFTRPVNGNEVVSFGFFCAEDDYSADGGCDGSPGTPRFTVIPYITIPTTCIQKALRELWI